MPLQSQNILYGFYGTIQSELSPLAWPIAMDLLQKEAGSREEYVRAFLDSRMGRSFADIVNDNVRYAKDLSGAIQLAVQQCNSWKLLRSDVSSAKIPSPLSSTPSVIKTKVWLAGHYMVSDLYNGTLEGMLSLFNAILFKPEFEQLQWEIRHLDIIKQVDEMPKTYHGVLSARLALSKDPQNHLVLQFGCERDSMVFRATQECDWTVSCHLADERIPLHEWEKALVAFQRISESIPKPEMSDRKYEAPGPQKSPCPR